MQSTASEGFSGADGSPSSLLDAAPSKITPSSRSAAHTHGIPSSWDPTPPKNTPSSSRTRYSDHYTSIPEPYFRVRLINIDHVVTTPGPLDRTESAFTPPGKPLQRVPVLRVFGATPAGQRVCAHIHGVFPYCYVKYTGSLDPHRVLSYIHRLGIELNAAIAVSLRRNPADVNKAEFIAAIHLCKGVPFYGYHVGWRYFLKISFVDPSQNVRIATILQSGKIMGTKMQPYEMHIRYNLQFMLDYNLYGCDYIDLERVFFRLPIPAADPYRSQDSNQHDEDHKLWTQDNVPAALVQAYPLHRHSHCELEIDANCAQILNRRKVRPRDLHNTFDETSGHRPELKLVPSLTGLWEAEEVRRVNSGLSPTIPSPETAGDRRMYSGDEAPSWLATHRHMSALAKRLEEEQKKSLQKGPRPKSSFTRTHELDAHIVTTFDSVSLLHDVDTTQWIDVSLDGASDVERGSQRAIRKSPYDLEMSLSQNVADLPPRNGSLSSAHGTQASDNSMAYADVDVAFFSSQAFQMQMKKAEEADTHGDGDDVDREQVKPHAAHFGRNDQKTTLSASSHSQARSTHSKEQSSLPKQLSSSKQSSSPSSGQKRRRTTSNAGDEISTNESRTSRIRFAASDQQSAILETTRYKTFHIPPPTRIEVERSFAYFGLPTVVHRDPYFSNPADVPKAREYAGRTFTFTSHSLHHLPHFDENREHAKVDRSTVRKLSSIRYWEYGPRPPTRAEVQDWLDFDMEQESKKRVRRKQRFLTQKVAITQPPSYGFKLSNRGTTSLAQRGKQHMTILAIENLVCTRSKLFPDPELDAVQVITYSFQHEDERLDDTGSRPGLRTGMIVHHNEEEAPNAFDPARLGLAHLAVEVVQSELELFNALIDLVRAFDPEIMVGYEIQSSSWGYLVERAMKAFEYDIIGELGRVNVHSTGSRNDLWGATQYSSLRFSGRHTLNIWRLMRGELALNIYSFENVVFHLLRRRMPKFDHATVTQWYTSLVPHQVARAILYWVERAEVDLEILEASELVFRTAEFARIYGIDFFSVISRGSQFKVESVMFRIAKPESFVLPSPSQQQVGQQNAAEDLPLVMEPLSAFYKGPVLVLDFQSLYPSIMVAYNICYSTCLGRVSKFRDAWKLGFTTHELPRDLLGHLKEDCFIAPNGLLYVKSRVRKSLLAKMLTEILDTRVMVKGSMKGNKHDRAFIRLQNARQLSLKLLANVTYGYTSATFSGRMPCVELADSIVRYGRETLEKAIELIHGESRWGAQVVYGDTDSLFVYLENRSKDEAFQIGQEIADAVTASNPRPVKLKFEKVYLPSVLLAKKRYVGFMYETPSDIVPTFNAKGIETVRRDGFPAQQRMVEACIRILFRTQDLSLVKAYCQRQWLKILQGKISLQDLVFAKEVKLGSYSENGVPPPGAALAAKRMLLDKRSQCQYGERVPYVISQGTGKTRLVDLARDPFVMVHDRRQVPHAQYYITRGLIPPLSRIFNLLGADVEAWYNELPKVMNSGSHSLASLMRDRQSAQSSRHPFGGRLLDHYRTDVCLVCRRVSEQEICLDCTSNASTTTSKLQIGLRDHQQRAWTIDHICTSCASSQARVNQQGVGYGHMGSCWTPGQDVACINTDCPLLYEKATTRDELDAREKLIEKWDQKLSKQSGSLEW